MNVELECFASLAKSGNCHFRERTTYQLVDGQTVADLVQRADLSPQDVETVFVNNIHADTEMTLSDGDRVGLVPALREG